jgi:hypothetical protein
MRSRGGRGGASEIFSSGASEIQPHLFDVAGGYACAIMVWAQRAKSQKNTVQRWRDQREQRERAIATRMHGRDIKANHLPFD